MSQHTELIAELRDAHQTDSSWNLSLLCQRAADALQAMESLRKELDDAKADYMRLLREKQAGMLQALERVPMPQEHIDEEWFHLCELRTNGLQKARLFARIVEAHHKITPPESKG